MVSSAYKFAIITHLFLRASYRNSKQIFLRSVEKTEGKKKKRKIHGTLFLEKILPFVLFSVHADIINLNDLYMCF